jgi:hypothetical protein
VVESGAAAVPRGGFFMPKTEENMSELGKNIAIHLYEHQREIWSHIPNFGGIARPRWYRPTSTPPAWVNPFTRKYRPAALTDEPAKLYNAIAFAQWSYGLVLNSHMTITWSLLGVRDHRQAVDILSKFNQEAGKWLAVDNTGRRRKNTNARTWGGRSLYVYAYIHECTNERGFHTHQLFHAPDGKAKAFSGWTPRRLAELAGLGDPAEDAVFFTPGTKREGFSPHVARFKKNEVERCWAYFRYLVKNLDPNVAKEAGGRSENQRAIFKAETNYVEPPLVHCKKLFGCSENIGIGEQRAAGFLSKFDTGDWDRLYDGSEMAEFGRFAEQQRQERELAHALRNITI